MDLSSFFAEQSDTPAGETVDIVFVGSEADKKMTEQEMNISEKLGKFTEIYTM